LSNEVNNMKKSGITILFVLVCIVVLVAAYGIGLWIKGMRLGGAKNESVAAAKSEKSAGELEGRQAQIRQMPGEDMNSPGTPSPEERAALVEQRDAMRQRFENMTDEEREAFRAQMRERFGGRRRGDMGPQLQLSDEERAKMREEINALREKWDQMSEEEREQARNQISEKYGFTPRGLGGGRGFGGSGEGSRRRNVTGSEEGQSDNNN
jgi:hypothetical protein